MKKEKLVLTIGAIVLLAVLISLGIWMLNVTIFNLTNIGSIAIIIILIATAAYILWDRLKNIQKGLPTKDERLTKINYKAGYYGFIAAIWAATFGPILIDIIWDFELEGHYVTALVVLVSGLTFIVSYLNLAWKGN